MRDFLDSTPTWGRQTLEVASAPAPSPTGRPYTPYPYRDLPPTPWDCARHAPLGPAPVAAVRQGDFHLFPCLPAELRLQIWSQAMLAACEYGRVHRARLVAVEDAPDTDGVPSKTPRLELAATPQLASSTRATRALLATCSEARREALSHLLSVLQDTLPLHNGGVLRCNLIKDIILLDSLSPSLLHSFSHPANHSLLRGIRRLGLDLTPQIFIPSTPSPASSPLPAETESALVSLTSLPSLTNLYLLQAPARVSLPNVQSNDNQGEEEEEEEDHLFFDATTITSTATTITNRPAAKKKRMWWYTARPPPAFCVGDSYYYAHLARLVRVLCRLRAGVVLLGGRTERDDHGNDRGDNDGEAPRGARIRLLGCYSSASCHDDEEGWEVSSPERCLEVGLGPEPRFVQWEWVCQCLDC